VKLDVEFSVKGTSHGSFHCSPYKNPNEGDKTETASHGYKVTIVDGGTCSRQGDAKRGYTVICNVSASYPDGSLLGLNPPPKAKITGWLRVVMTPL
jgi:hypothetical protein